MEEALLLPEAVAHHPAVAHRACLLHLDPLCWGCRVPTPPNGSTSGALPTHLSGLSTYRLCLTLVRSPGPVFIPTNRESHVTSWTTQEVQDAERQAREATRELQIAQDEAERQLAAVQEVEEELAAGSKIPAEGGEGSTGESGSGEVKAKDEEERQGWAKARRPLPDACLPYAHPPAP